MPSRARPAPAGADVRPASKTRRKRHAAELQRLGESLLGYGPEVLAQLPLTKTLRDAIQELRHTRTHGARRRQLQFLGRLMREEDEQAIRRALKRLNLPPGGSAHTHKALESLRGSLVAGGEAVIERFLRTHPSISPKQLRPLLREARQPGDAGRAAARRLFRLLRRASLETKRAPGG